MTNKIATVVWKSAASEQRLRKLLAEIGAICVEESEGGSYTRFQSTRWVPCWLPLRKPGFSPT